MSKFYFLFLIFLTMYSVHAQHTNILISTTDSPNEPSILINPKNTQEIVAGANLNNVYVSDDGGVTWTEGKMSSSYGVWGDPVIGVDTAGAFYFFHLSNPPSGNWIDRIVCQKLDSLTGTWSDGTFTGLNGTKAQDKQWVAVDRNTNAMYLTWTQFDEYGSTISTDSSNIMFSKSLDGGLTWSAALRINEVAGDCIDSDETTEGAVPAVGPNGEVYVAWTGPEGIVFDRSLDGGTTWLDNDIFISDQIGGWDFYVPGTNRCNGLPVTDCDLSGGPNHGAIYVNWTDQRNGSHNTDVFLSKSTDGGNTWSAPVKVNDDTTGKHQFFTWMDIDQATGYLWFVWYDRRNYDDNRTDVYMAVSKDGGSTFENFRVSESPFTPSESIFFGDYTNVSAHNGVVRPIWGRMDLSVQSIYSAIIDTAAISGIETEPMISGQIDIYPNPSADIFMASYKLHEYMTVDVSIINAMGQIVAIVLQEEQGPGRHNLQISGEEYGLQSGYYTLRIHSNEVNLTKGFVIY